MPKEIKRRWLVLQHAHAVHTERERAGCSRGILARSMTVYLLPLRVLAEGVLAVESEEPVLGPCTVQIMPNLHLAGHAM